MVFLYSARLRRRIVTLPGSRLPWSAAAKRSRTAFWNASASSTVGCGRPWGGISPAWIICTTCVQTLRPLSRACTSL